MIKYSIAQIDMVSFFLKDYFYILFEVDCSVNPLVISKITPINPRYLDSAEAVDYNRVACNRLDLGIKT